MRPNKFQFKNFNIELIIEMYIQGEKLKDISNKVSISVPHLINCLREKGLKRNKLELDKNEIVNLYEKGFSTNQISKFLEIPKTNIHRRFKAYGIKISLSEAKRNPFINHSAFSSFTNKTCYWGGMLAADGCVTENGSIILSLQTLDKTHVEKFGRFVNYNKSVQVYNNMSRISFGSQEMKKDLENFNIVPRKTHILKPISILNDEQLIKNFIRGYLDGDGCIHKTGFSVSFAGTFEMLSWIKEKLRYFCSCGNPSVFKVKGGTTTHEVKFNGKTQSRRILNWLYKDSTEETRLDRKYKIAKDRYNIIEV
jgi:hypothetical protein